MSFETILRNFATALTDPSIIRPDEQRFAVYRNNVALSLRNALAARFPIVHRLVGKALFSAISDEFIAKNKPKNAVLIHYGEDFVPFLRQSPLVADIPYLPDVAALENAWIEAYHAREAPALTLEDLQGLIPELWGTLCFTPHPAVRLLRFLSPAASIWEAHQGETLKDIGPWQAQDVLITRPEAEVFVRVLPAAGADLFLRLCEGTALEQAAEPLLEQGEDVGVHLIGLIQVGAFTKTAFTQEET